MYFCLTKQVLIQTENMSNQISEQIEREIARIKAELPCGVELLAVSKTHPVEYIQYAYNAGQRWFAENKVQEMTQKYESLPKDIKWHFIGHVQTNKIKLMAPYVSMIHGIDSFKALAEVNKRAAENNRVIDCLLQIHIATEETKFGFTPFECFDMLNTEDWRSLCNVRIRGVMGMASLTDNKAQVQTEFMWLKETFIRLKLGYFRDKPTFNVISAGMSHDYRIAVEEGSTMVRIGTTIFGKRY